MISKLQAFREKQVPKHQALAILAQKHQGSVLGIAEVQEHQAS